MDILYVGNEINGSFISEISKKDKITYSGTYTRVADLRKKYYIQQFL